MTIKSPTISGALLALLLMISVANAPVGHPVDPSVARGLKLIETTPAYDTLAKRVGYGKAIQVANLIEDSEYPEVIRAIIRIESNWDPEATSCKNARGLMQVMLCTARDVDSTITAADLYDPVTNVKLGIKLFKGHMLHFKERQGTKHWALTSYWMGRRGAAKMQKYPPVTKYSKKVLSYCS